MSAVSNVLAPPWIAMLDDAPDGVVIAAGRPWRLIYANGAFCRLVGREIEELREQPLANVFSVEASPAILEGLAQFDRGGAESATGSHEIASADGSTRLVELRLHHLAIEPEPILGIWVLASDVDPRTAASDREARRDPLTGLPDRTALLARLTTLLARESPANRRFALVFIDLDNFKQVNDGHGHLVGDQVLGEVGRRLAESIRAGDMIVRFGGDEFVALVENVSSAREIQPIVDRVRRALVEPIELPGGEATLSVSIGIAQASPDHRTPEDLLGEADRAMYALKRTGIWVNDE